MSEEENLPIIDVHTHLAGLGHCDSGCFIDSKKFQTLLYKLMRSRLGLYNAHKDGKFDEEYLERLRKDLDDALQHKALSAAVVFPHEKIYSDNGEVLSFGQELYVPNEYVFKCAERENIKGRFLPAMSVHPYRKDAVEETQKYIDRGAVAMKWLPNSQGMDPRDDRCKPVFELLAKNKIPLIAHTGGEHTVSIIRPELGDPETLRPALEQGVSVIMAHCGTKSGMFDTDWLPAFCRMAQEYPHCWGDNSAFTTPGRTRWMQYMLDREEILKKIIHGSDYPVPPGAWWSLRKLGWSKAKELAAIWSFLERDVRIKEEYGFPKEVFMNAARVLRPGFMEFWDVKV